MGQLPIVAPLTDADIEWRPFVRDIDVIQADASIEAMLLGLSDDDLRLYCVSLWEDRRAVSAALHEAVAMLAVVTTQRDQLREQNRQRRAIAAELVREAAA